MASKKNPVRLGKYILPYKAYALAAPLLMVLEVVCDLMQPRFMASLIDRGVAQGDFQYILMTGGFMLLAAVLGIVGGVGCTVFATLASQHYGKDLRNDLFKKIESFSFRSLDGFSSASLITRLTNDVMQLQGMVLMMLRIMVRAPILCIGGIVMAFSIDAALALTALSVLPVLAVVLTLVIRRGFPLFALVQEKVDRLNLVIRESLSNVRVVKAFVRQDFEMGRFGKANNALSGTAVQATRVVGTSMPLMMLIMNTGIILVVWFGGHEVAGGSLRIGQIMALLNYVTQILFSLMMSAMLVMSFSRAKVSADRVREVLAKETDIEDGSRTGFPQPGRIDFDQVSFRYSGAKGEEVLKDVSFSVEPGTTLAILGPTGAGKSTLINLIPRFYDTSSGSVRVHGADVKEYSLAALRSSIGIAMQTAVLFSGTIRDNIRWGLPEAEEDAVVQAATIAGAHDFIQAFPQGYDTPVDQGGTNLSGGQKQRLSLARSLLRKPSILILDDATSAVDVATEARIRRALSKALPGTTIVLIAQRVSSVQDADRILILDAGGIQGSGTHQELLRENPSYQELYRSQVGEADLDLPAMEANRHG